MSETHALDLKQNTIALLNRRDTQVWLVILTAVSLGLGLVLFPAEWSVGRKLAGGLLTGVGSVFCVFLPRMIGGRDFN